MCIDVLQYPIHSHSAYLGVGFWGLGLWGYGYMFFMIPFIIILITWGFWVWGLGLCEAVPCGDHHPAPSAQDDPQSRIIVRLVDGEKED